jgi:integrase
MAKKIDIQGKKPRRGKGEGTISKRTDGRYMAKITLGRNLNGKLVRKCIYGYSETEVIEKKTKLMAKVFSGVYSEPSKINISQWLDTWFNTYKKMYIKEQTSDLYLTMMDSVINPRIGELKLRDIKQMHIQELVNRLCKDGYATSTIYKVKNILNPAFRIAKMNKLIQDNPFQNIQMPQGSEKQVLALSRQEQAKFEANVGHSNFHELFITALDSGIRIGELLALTWKDINFNKKEINITKTLITKREEKTGKKVLEVQHTPKTKSSNRTVPMTKRVYKLLCKLLTKRKENCFKDNNIVFCSKVGTYAYPKNIRRSLGIIFKRSGIDLSGVHILRHTFATRLFEESVAIKTISKILGHCRIEITLNIYTHIFKESEEKAIDVLDNLDLLINQEKDNSENKE